MIGSAAVKSIDDAPYALVGATLGAVGFLLGNLVLNYGSWLVGAFHTWRSPRVCCRDLGSPQQEAFSFCDRG
jgi:hypothetical protein